LIAERVSVNETLHFLQSANQEPHKSPLLDRRQPEFCWIFENLDFQHWETASCSQTLWLYGPPERNMHHVSSYIVNENLLKTQRTVLYYFCSSITSEKSAVSQFVRALLYQFIHYSPQEKQKPIVINFFRSLLKSIYKEEDYYHKELEILDDCVEKWLNKTFDTPTEALWTALMTTLAHESNRELLIVIDGLEKVQDDTSGIIGDFRELIDYLQQRILIIKVLFTSQPQAGIKRLLNGLPYIEYDKERKGKF
jgi:hypothetical protein